MRAYGCVSTLEQQEIDLDLDLRALAKINLSLRPYAVSTYSSEQKHFSGSFDPSCLRETVSKPLLTLLDVLLEASSSSEDKLA